MGGEFEKKGFLNKGMVLNLDKYGFSLYRLRLQNQNQFSCNVQLIKICLTQFVHSCNGVDRIYPM